MWPVVCAVCTQLVRPAAAQLTGSLYCTFRLWFSQLPSYGVSILYVLADTRNQVRRTEAGCSDASTGLLVRTGVDALTWQLFASVLCPGLFINRTVYFSGAALRRTPLPAAAQRWAPVAIGLATIPLIVKPIDAFVTSVMNKSLRPLLGTPQTPVHS